MNNEILSIYNTFQSESLNLFFDSLISFVNKYHTTFSNYVTRDYLELVVKFQSNDFILGHSDDNFESEISYYRNLAKQGLDEEGICIQVASLIWNLSEYMLNEICPNCHDSNLRLSSSIKSHQTIKFCDECLYTGIDEKFIEIDEELVPANKNQVNSYLKDKI